MAPIRNPILPGFHPDPSIVRVGDDFYVATSTFEWFPGVALFHSRDMRTWGPIGHVATRRSQLDLLGVDNSAGLWAPSLSYNAGTFYLVVCHVRTRVSNFKDMRVLLYTSNSIAGPWSEPVVLGGSGFDPSLFHDPLTGRKWLVNIQWDARKGKARFAGIVLQEYDSQQQKLVGTLRTILTKPQLVEGPNLYYRDGWYYLMLAEGGTGWNHGISIARSKQIDGPYELDPQPLLLTSRLSPGNELQKAGHGEIVQTAAGEWYLVHLASRCAYPERRAILGRETCLQKVDWSPDGWLRLAHGGSDPAVEVPPPHGIETPPITVAASRDDDRDDFDDDFLTPHWQSLRAAADPTWCDLTTRRGWLRLRGRESVHSLFEQSLIARRLESVAATAETCIEFEPAHFTQAAGLICWYDTRTHFYLRMTHDETAGRVLGIITSDDGVYDEQPLLPIPIRQWPRVYMRATLDALHLRFSVSPDGQIWQAVGGALDRTKLSDDYGQGLHFTGPMIGLCCQDLNSAAATADFDYFALRSELEIDAAA